MTWKGGLAGRETASQLGYDRAWPSNPVAQGRLDVTRWLTPWIPIHRAGKCHERRVYRERGHVETVDDAMLDVDFGALARFARSN